LCTNNDSRRHTSYSFCSVRRPSPMCTGGSFLLSKRFILIIWGEKNVELHYALVKSGAAVSPFGGNTKDAWDEIQGGSASSIGWIICWAIVHWLALQMQFHRNEKSREAMLLVVGVVHPRQGIWFYREGDHGAKIISSSHSPERVRRRQCFVSSGAWVSLDVHHLTVLLSNPTTPDNSYCFVVFPATIKSQCFFLTSPLAVKPILVVIFFGPALSMVRTMYFEKVSTQQGSRTKAIPCQVRYVWTDSSDTPCRPKRRTRNKKWQRTSK